MTRVRLVFALFVAAGCLPLVGCGGEPLPEPPTMKDLRNRGGAVPTKDGKPPKPPTPQ